LDYGRLPFSANISNRFHSVTVFINYRIKREQNYSRFAGIVGPITLVAFEPEGRHMEASLGFTLSPA
jgi:hypothetical protein